MSIPGNQVSIDAAAARAQVDAFVGILQERFDLNDERVKRLASRASTNGKIYITYSVVVAVLISALAWYYVRDTNRDDLFLRNLELRLDVFDNRQSDVRERLKLVEARLGTIEERTRIIEERTRLIEERLRVIDDRTAGRAR